MKLLANEALCRASFTQGLPVGGPSRVGFKPERVVMIGTDQNGLDEKHASSTSGPWQDAFEPIPNIFSWYKDHAAAGTLIVGAFLVIKGYVIARGNLATALGILQYAGLTSVIVAGLLSSLPILTALMLGWTIFRMARGWNPKFKPRSWIALAWVLIGSLVLSVFVTPLPYMLAAIVLGSLGGLVKGRWPEDWKAGVSKAVVLIVGGIGTVLMLYAVWVPHEIVVLTPAPTGIGVTSNERVVTVLGYVLADDPGGWITILRSGSRTIVRFRDATVKSITVCQRTPSGGISDIFYASTPWNWISRFLGNLRPGNYVRCP